MQFATVDEVISFCHTERSPVDIKFVESVVLESSDHLDEPLAIKHLEDVDNAKIAQLHGVGLCNRDVGKLRRLMVFGFAAYYARIMRPAVVNDKQSITMVTLKFPVECHNLIREDNRAHTSFRLLSYVIGSVGVRSDRDEDVQSWFTPFATICLL